MKRFGGLLITLGLGLAAIPASALSLETRTELLLWGQGRHLHQSGFSEYVTIWELSGQAGQDFWLRSGGFQLEIRPELRVLASPGVGVDPETDPAFISIQPRGRRMRLDSELQKSDNQTATLDFEKLNVSYQNDWLELALGRRALSFGVLRFLPVWNKFTVPLPTNAGTPYVYNPDQALLRLQRGEWSFGGFLIEGEKDADEVTLAQVSWFSPWIELQVLGGRWWEHQVAGFAFAKDVRGMTLRSEWLFIGLNDVDVEHQTQGGLGVEYAFDDRWSVLAEGLYLDHGTETKEDLVTHPSSRFTPFRARAYLLALAEYRINAFWNIQAGPFASLVDASALWQTRVRHSLSDHMDFSLNVSWPIGDDGSELGPRFLVLADDVYVGSPGTASAQLQIAF